MKKVFADAELVIGFWNAPEKEKGEVNPYTANDPKQKYNPFVDSAKVEIKQEHVVELIEWLENKGYYTRHVRELAPELEHNWERLK
ncbi:hypothetical protein ACFWGC_29700 [Cytobacillus pseudoceanisediminis]|uniref:hypothetical protein n=1 Tax=Cytobacillus pseudoceanisediminis TaxID=3051614 RepID=UPI003651CE6D